VLVVGSSRYLFNRSDVTLESLQLGDVLQTHKEDGQDTLYTYPIPSYEVRDLPPHSYAQLPDQKMGGMQSWKIARAEWGDGTVEEDSTSLLEHKIWSLVNFEETEVHGKVRRTHGQQRLKRSRRDTRYIGSRIKEGTLYLVNRGSVRIDEIEVKRFCYSKGRSEEGHASGSNALARGSTAVFRLNDIPGGSEAVLEHGIDEDRTGVQLGL
jgi:hypothetical protein